MRLFLLIGFFVINALAVRAQLISYSIHEGDTINMVDKDSLRQGVWRNFWPSGKLSSEVVYRNNKKQGLEISWYNHSHCVKQETYYNNGQLDGPVTFYSKNCAKEFIENYLVKTEDEKDKIDLDEMHETFRAIYQNSKITKQN